MLKEISTRTDSRPPSTLPGVVFPFFIGVFVVGEFTEVVDFHCCCPDWLLCTHCSMLTVHFPSAETSSKYVPASLMPTAVDPSKVPISLARRSTLLPRLSKSHMPN